MRSGIGSAVGTAARALGPSWRSLRTKIIVWFFVPTAIILVTVALVNFYSYQDVTEDLVMERDQDLTHLSAVQLSTQLKGYTDRLVSVARGSPFLQSDPIARQAALRASSSRFLAFDSGVVVLNNYGTVVAALPEDPNVIGQDWSNTGPFRQMVRTPGPVFSDILEEELDGPPIVVAAVPIVGERGEFLGSLVGKFGVAETAVSSFYGTIVKLRPGQSSRTYLVDASGRVIFHSRADQIGADFSAQPVVRQVLEGQVGAIRTEDFDGADIVAGFAPVPGTPWALITEERWDVLTGGSRGYQRFLILLLVLGAAVPILFVVIGLRTIMKPLEDLVGAAREVARGNFGRTIAAKSGDEIGQLVEEFNTMAGALKESRDAIFVSSQGIVVAANQAALDLFGFTIEEAIGSNVADHYTDPSDQVRFRQEIGKMGSIRDFEVKLSKKDGTVIDCLVTATRRNARDESGPPELQGLVRDITERKRAEEALRESEEKYRALFDRSIHATFITSHDARIIDANQATLDLFGYTWEEAIQVNTLSVSNNPEDRARFQKEIEGQGSVTDFEVKLGKNDGTEMDCLITANVIRDNEGVVVGYEGTIRDVTERKRAEDALRESEDRFRRLMDNAADGFFVMSPDGKIVDINQMASQQFGFSREELLESSATDVYVTFGDTEPAKLYEMVRPEGPVTLEGEGRRKDGNTFPVEMRLGLIELAGRRHMFALVRDITERKEAENTQVQQMRELAVLEERNRMAREIHDTLAQGFTGIVLQLEAADQALEGEGTEVADHLVRAKGLARESLQEARRSVWGLVPHALEQDTLEEALRKRVEQVNASGSTKASFKLSGPPRVLSADVQAAILRICQESLTNVTRHSEAKDVTVDLRFDPTEVRLKVQDDGMGFDINEVKANHQGGSFGLLGMEQRVSLLGGTFAIKSRKGRGTTVEVQVPVQ